MPKGKSLSEYEKGYIDSLNTNGMTIAQISSQLCRSKNVVSNYLKLGDKYGSKNKNRGRKPLLSLRDKRIIHKEAVVYGRSVRKITDERFPHLSYSTVYSSLMNNEEIIYKHTKPRPPLKPIHISARLEFAWDKRTWTDQWKSVVFSDEKRFNLDGPDGYTQYWHNINYDDKIFSKRQNGIFIFILSIFYIN